MQTVVLYAGIGVASGPLVASWSHREIETQQSPTTEWCNSAKGPAHRIAGTSVLCGGLLAVLATRFPDSAALPAWCWMALTGTALAAVDIDCRRLPHRMVAAMSIGGFLLLGAASILEHDVTPLLRAGLAGVSTFVLALLLALASQGMGCGDVTLSGTLAIFLGWTGWQYLLPAALATTLLGVLAAATLHITAGSEWDRQLPFGPCLLVGFYLVLVFQ